MKERHAARPPQGPLDRCPNCGVPLDGQFCTRCGQNNRHARLDARELLGSAFEHLLELDLPVIRTIAGLTRHPGRVCRAYVEGHRRPYSNPIQYAFMMACLVLLVFTLFDVDPAQAILGEAPAPSKAEGEPPPTRGQRAEAYIREHAPRQVQQNLNFVAFFSVPFVACALTVLFRSSGLTYGEHLAFALFTYGHLFFVNAIVSVLGVLHDWRGLVAIQVFEFGYLTWAGLTFYGVGLFGTLWRMILASCSYMVGTSILGSALVVAWAFYVAFFGDL